MNELKFGLVLQAIDRATAPIKRITAALGGVGSAAATASRVATQAASKFTAATERGALSQKHLASAAAGVARMTDSGASSMNRLHAVLSRIGSLGGLRKQAADADHLGHAAGHAGHRLKALLRSLAEMSELGPLGHLAAHIAPWAGAAALGFGAVVGVRGLFELGGHAAEHSSQAALNAQKAGVKDIRDYQRLAYAAQQAEVTPDQLNDGLKRFGRNSYNVAKYGGPLAKVFKDIGVSVKGAHGQLKPVPDLVVELADKFAAFSDPARKQAIAMGLFGKSGANMIPLLNKGGAAIHGWMKEADESGVVMDEISAKKAEAYIEAHRKMGAAVEGLKIGLGNALLPVLTLATNKITAYLNAHRPQIIEVFTKVVKALTVTLPTVLKNLKPLFALDWAGFATTVAKAAGGIASFTRAIGGLGTILDVGVVALIVRAGAAVAGFATVIAGALGVAVAPVLGVIAAITGLAVAGYLLVRHWGEIWGGITRVLGNAVGLCVDLITWLTPAPILMSWFKLPGQLKAVLDRVQSTFTSSLDRIWGSFPDWFKLLLKANALALRLVIGLPPMPRIAIPSLPPTANDNGRKGPSSIRPAGMSAAIRPLGAPMALRAMGPPMSLGRRGDTGSDPAPPNGRLAVDIRIHQDGRPPEVIKVVGDPSRQFLVDIKRGQAA